MGSNDISYKTVVKIHESLFKIMGSALKCAAAVLVISSIIKKNKSLRKKRKQKTVSVKPLLNRRNELGVYKYPFEGIAYGGLR